MTSSHEQSPYSSESFKEVAMDLHELAQIMLKQLERRKVNEQDAQVAADLEAYDNVRWELKDAVDLLDEQDFTAENLDALIARLEGDLEVAPDDLATARLQATINVISDTRKRLVENTAPQYDEVAEHYVTETMKNDGSVEFARNDLMTVIEWMKNDRTTYTLLARFLGKPQPS